MSTIGGAFYLENSLTGVTSTSNFYKNCYTCHSGGVFTLKNTFLVDTSSEFYHNAATYGGVFKCDGCEITLTSSSIYDNDAYTGGVLHSENSVKMLVTMTQIYKNKAKANGGVLSVTNPTAASVTPNSIVFT